MKEEYFLEVKEVSKSFPGVKALDNVSFQLDKGEIHALVGENGAGKSTLIKILCGVYKEDAGSIFLDGKQIRINGVPSARLYGIGFVPQEIELMEYLSIEENIFVGKYPNRFGFVDWKELKRKTDEVKNLFKGVISEIKNDTLVQELSIANKQLIEILKALALDMKVLCLDEPTSSLTKEETDILFQLLNELKKKGISIIYVSHRMEEIFQIADRVTVFKDGKFVNTSKIKDITIENVVNSMVGRDLSFLKKLDRTEKISEENALEVKDLNLKNKFKSINFRLRKGEILGWFGLIGSGRSEVAKAIFGIDKYDSGDIKIFGKSANLGSSKKAIRNGIGLAPEDRHAQGLVLSMDINNNINLPIYNVISKFGFVSLKAEKDNSLKYIKELSIKTPSIRTAVDSLSGGNKQKVSIAKWLNASSEILIFDEPTKGIDVGSKNEIYKLMRELADLGKSIIFISSELPEILNLSDRILVFKEGKIMKEINNSFDVQEYDIFKYAISEET
jgi:ABC-type sugar transport system ATPase subunit